MSPAVPDRADPCPPQECSALGDMPGSFVPTVTAITTSQDLQWLVQPTLISSVAPGAPMAQPPPLDPYDLPGPSYSTPGLGAFAGPPAPAPTRAPRARPRRSREETVRGDSGGGGTLGTWEEFGGVVSGRRLRDILGGGSLGTP